METEKELEDWRKKFEAAAGENRELRLNLALYNNPTILRLALEQEKQHAAYTKGLWDRIARYEQLLERYENALSQIADRAFNLEYPRCALESVQLLAKHALQKPNT